jgi:abscisic-aldehyde oxidase
METQATLVIPDEDGCMLVYCSTQSPSYVQQSIAACLGLPMHNIRVITRRIGGGFGGKVTRCLPLAVSCALVAYKLKQPVRMVLDRNTDMVLTGGRSPTHTKFKMK